MFEWTREVPPAWREALYPIGGAPNRNAAYLDIVWWPGEPPHPGAERQDVQRWAICEHIPEAALVKTPQHKLQARDLLKALHGPPPALLRSWVVRNGRRAIKSGSLVSQWQWELFRTTGCYVQPYWIIQGRNGGHLWMFPPAYQLLLRMAGRPLSPPAPGTLPYAEWDNRVRAQLVRERELRDWLQRHQMTRDQGKKTAKDHKREDVALEREGRRQLLAWLDQQLGMQADALGTHLSHVDMPIRPDLEPTDEALEQQEQEILASTPTNPHDL